MSQPTRKELNMEMAIGDAETHLGLARVHLEGKHGKEAMAQMVMASDSLDEAMEILDELMQPEPTRDEWEGL